MAGRSRFRLNLIVSGLSLQRVHSDIEWEAGRALNSRENQEPAQRPVPFLGDACRSGGRWTARLVFSGIRLVMVRP